MRQYSRELIRLACLLGILSMFAKLAYAIDTVTLQLKWTHAFQFAGYYAAKERGYYRDAGIDVRIDEALPGTDPVKNVLEGKAEFGVGTSALLLERNAGKPIVALAVIFQHSPYVLIARQQNTAQSIHDLIGKRVMLEPQADEILAYLRQEGIQLNRITQLEHSYDPQDLIEAKTDAIAGYVTNQPYYLNRAHLAYQIYTPRSAGIDFYGDNLFTTEQELRAHPGRVKAFRAASLLGWQYAMEHPDEIIDVILTKYSQRHTREYYQFEAKQMIPLLRPELIEIGYMYSGRWRHMAETYADIGMLPRDFSFDGFLYEPNPKPDLAWLYQSLAASLLLIGTVSAIALYIGRNNRRLARSLDARKQVEEKLRKLSHAVEQSPAATIITDTEGRFEYVNPKFLEITGYSQEELIGKTPRVLKSGLTQPYVYENLWNTIRSGREWHGEIQNRRKNGEIYWEHEIISPLKDEQGKIISFIAIKEDITDHKNAEDALQLKQTRLLETERELLKAQESLAEADRLESVGRLAAGVAHEVKNPLAIIRLGVDYLAKQYAQPSNQGMVDDLRVAIDRADNVVMDLLDFARQKPFALAEISIDHVIDNAIRLVKHEMEYRNIVVARDRDNHVPLIFADPDRLVQVFINLLSNSAQAIGQNGLIQIRSRLMVVDEVDGQRPDSNVFDIGEQVVAVEIRDNGPGFPAEYERKLFEPFFTTKPMGEGSGLGLAVSRSIIIRHRGSISISNRPEGGASTLLMFRVDREHFTND